MNQKFGENDEVVFLYRATPQPEGLIGSYVMKGNCISS